MKKLLCSKALRLQFIGLGKGASMGHGIIS